MVELEMEKELRLTEDGKCPVCYSQIRIAERAFIIIKTRLVKKFHGGKVHIKCTKCKNMISEN